MVDEGGGGWKEAELEKEMRFYALKRYWDLMIENRGVDTSPKSWSKWLDYASDNGTEEGKHRKLPGGGLGRSVDPEWNLEWETWGFKGGTTVGIPT
jgi:hypothetical protein